VQLAGFHSVDNIL